MEEHVLVVPTSVFHELGRFDGLSRDVERYLSRLLDPALGRYLPRSQMESDPSFKQLIPYVVLHYQDGNGESWVFAYTRGSGQGERRLHRKRSIGIGGHISQEDASSGPPYEIGMRRELDEEVEIGSGLSETLVGLINDDQSEVGRVHLGVVHRFDLERPEVRPREADLAEAGFVKWTDALSEIDQFETWSQFCLQHLSPIR